MNERIKQLAEQAELPLLDVDGNCKYGDTYFSKEKFAELIVRECSKVIVNGGYRNPALGDKHPLTPPEIAQMIREHFGVE